MLIALGVSFALAAASGALPDDSPKAGVTVQGDPPPIQPSVPRTSTSGLEHRVAVLTKALNLDAHQQAELRGIIVSQRESVRQIWRDPALLPSERAPATLAVEDRTADQIRAILTDEQKEKYNPPKAPAAARPESPDVAAWMEKTRAK